MTSRTITPPIVSSSQGDLEELTRSWLRDLRAGNYSVRTVQSYGESMRLLSEYLVAQGIEGVDRFEFEEAYNNQSLVTSIYRLNRPLYDDVADYFNQRGVSPTHLQFLTAHDALLRQRNVK